MSVPPVSSPLSPKSEPLFDESLELSEGSRFQEDFGSSTITPASTTPVTAPVEQQAACCLTRCLSYLGEQIFDFFDWVCSLFVSSKPVTEESLSAFIEEFKKEFEKKFGLLMELIGKRYPNLKNDTCDTSDKRLDNLYLYFADGIKLITPLVEAGEITRGWEGHLGRLKKAIESDKIITKKMLQSGKNQVIELCNKSHVLACTTFPLSSLESSEAIVKAFCLGGTTVATQEGIRSLIDVIGVDSFPGALRDLGADFNTIVVEQRESHAAQFGERIKELRCRIEVRYAGIKPDNIEGDSAVIALLADAIEIFTRYDGLLKGDISNTSTIEKRLGELETLLDPANPIIKTVTLAMHEAVTCFDFDSGSFDSGSTGIIYRILYQGKADEWYKSKEYTIAEEIEARLKEVIDTLQNPIKDSEEV